MRLLVCRPLAEGEATAARLRALGHEPVVAPLLSIEPKAVVIPAGRIDALLATSRHAFTGLGAAEGERLRALPLLAVGEATARAARARGFADVRIGQGDAAGLVALARLTLPAGARLLYLAGETRKDALAEALLNAGDDVTIAESYAARAVETWPQEAAGRLRTGRLDGCLHFSRRSAELAIQASEAAQVAAAFVALQHFCLSDDVAAPLRAHGAAVTVAARPTEDRLMQAIPPTLP